MRNKIDLDKIKNLLDDLCVGNISVDRNIPKYLYHFSDIENIISIMKCESLYSRNYVVQNQLMLNDNANQDVISITENRNKDYVRLYFRPKTPTQFHNEGIKSNFRDYDNDAHCPIPIFLLFSTEEILSRKDSKFVERNLALRPVIKEEIDDLIDFDFDKIYHNGPTGGDRDIIEKRHAEVLIDEQLDLKGLKLIVVRSLAERETLINLLQDNNIDTSQLVIKHDRRSILFYKSKAYIDYVELESDYFKIGFVNFESFSAEDKVLLQLKKPDKILTKSISPFECKNGLRFNMKTKKSEYELSVFVNDKCVYLGRYISDDNLPF